MRLKSLNARCRANRSQFNPRPGLCSILCRDRGKSPRPPARGLKKLTFTNRVKRRAKNEPRNALIETICGIDLMRLWRVEGKKSSAAPASPRIVLVDATAAFIIPTFSDLFIIFSFTRQTDGPHACGKHNGPKGALWRSTTTRSEP